MSSSSSWNPPTRLRSTQKMYSLGVPRTTCENTVAGSRTIILDNKGKPVNKILDTSSSSPAGPPFPNGAGGSSSTTRLQVPSPGKQAGGSSSTARGSSSPNGKVASSGTRTSASPNSTRGPLAQQRSSFRSPNGKTSSSSSSSSFLGNSRNSPNRNLSNPPRSPGEGSVREGKIKGSTARVADRIQAFEKTRWNSSTRVGVGGARGATPGASASSSSTASPKPAAAVEQSKDQHRSVSRSLRSCKQEASMTVSSFLQPPKSPALLQKPNATSRNASMSSSSRQPLKERWPPSATTSQHSGMKLRSPTPSAASANKAQQLTASRLSPQPSHRTVSPTPASSSSRLHQTTAAAANKVSPRGGAAAGGVYSVTSTGPRAPPGASSRSTLSASSLSSTTAKNNVTTPRLVATGASTASAKRMNLGDHRVFEPPARPVLASSSSTSRMLSTSRTSDLLQTSKSPGLTASPASSTTTSRDKWVSPRLKKQQHEPGLVKRCIEKLTQRQTPSPTGRAPLLTPRQEDPLTTSTASSRLVVSPTAAPARGSQEKSKNTLTLPSPPNRAPSARNIDSSAEVLISARSSSGSTTAGAAAHIFGNAKQSPRESTASRGSVKISCGAASRSSSKNSVASHASSSRTSSSRVVRENKTPGASAPSADSVEMTTTTPTSEKKDSAILAALRNLRPISQASTSVSTAGSNSVSAGSCSTTSRGGSSSSAGRRGPEFHTSSTSCNSTVELQDQEQLLHSRDQHDPRTTEQHSMVLVPANNLSSPLIGKNLLRGSDFSVSSVTSNDPCSSNSAAVVSFGFDHSRTKIDTHHLRSSNNGSSLLSPPPAAAADRKSRSSGKSGRSSRNSSSLLTSRSSGTSRSSRTSSYSSSCSGSSSRGSTPSRRRSASVRESPSSSSKVAHSPHRERDAQQQIVTSSSKKDHRRRSSTASSSMSFDPWDGFPLYEDMIRRSVYDLGFDPALSNVETRPTEQVRSKEGAKADAQLEDVRKMLSGGSSAGGQIGNNSGNGGGGGRASKGSCKNYKDGTNSTQIMDSFWADGFGDGIGNATAVSFGF
ncbi:unnamed protein product [Amoebophrya sp. A120]|nr:unnamed protein product [Amoebophrya sp. A120]|eukprot:GSA120T00008315001.1